MAELMQEAMSRLERCWRANHEIHYDQPGSTAGTILYPAAHATASGQSTYDQFVSRHLPHVAEVRATTVAYATERLVLQALDAPLIVRFLDDLEKQHGLSARSRNLRLTAIHSFFRYAAFEAPDHAAQIQRVLGIPVSGLRERRYISSRVRRLRRCLPRLINVPGLAGVITHFSW